LLGEVLCVFAGRIRCWLGRYNLFPGLSISRILPRSVWRDELVFTRSVRWFTYSGLSFICRRRFIIRGRFVNRYRFDHRFIRLYTWRG
jgi:hypothetical protein